MRIGLCFVVLGAAAFGAADPALEGFSQRLEQYVKLRRELAARIPGIGNKATAEQIQRHEASLAAALRAARPGAKQGDILTANVRPAFARILEDRMSGSQGRKVRAAIKEGNPSDERAPGEVRPVLRVNDTYPKNAPLSTVPPTLLLKLPKLPKDVEYRFAGRTLLLRDRQANIVIDYMTDAVPRP